MLTVKPSGILVQHPAYVTAPLCRRQRRLGLYWQKIAPAFADNVPGMSSDNCVSEASAKSIVAASMSGSGGGGGSAYNAGGGGGSGAGGSSKGGSGSSGHPMQPWTYLFAAFLAVGGVMAYVKKGSAKSAGASLSATLILLLAARAMAGPTAVNAARVAFALCLLLGIVMANRFTRSKKVMPAGLVAGSSLLMAAGFVGVGL